MTPGDTIKAAAVALRLNAMRSMLTTLGIIIGVASVIVMGAVGSGARQSVENQINALGPTLLTISPGSSRGGGRSGGAGTAPALSEADIAAIRERITDIAAMSGNLTANVPVVAGNANWTTQVAGVHADYPDVRDWTVADGRFFAVDDVERAARYAILGTTVSQQLFGDASPVGETIRINGVPFEVIGLMAKRGVAGGGRDQDDTILIPITTARSRVAGRRGEAVPNQVGSILIKVASVEAVPYVQEEVSVLLRERRRIGPDDPDNFSVRNPADIVATRNETQTTLSWLLGATAAVSLIVGGIGIMNIMLVSVTERIREIGLRIAVGAKRRDIMSQFLTEAVVLCTAGGFLGLLIGIGGTYVIASFADWPVLIDMEMVAIAIAASAGVGVVFGFVPARRAAGLNPIEALRHE